MLCPKMGPQMAVVVMIMSEQEDSDHDGCWINRIKAQHSSRILLIRFYLLGKVLPLLSPLKAHYLQAGYLGPDYSNSLHQIKDSHHAISLLSCQAVALHYSEAAPQMDSRNKPFLCTQ